MKDTEPMLAEFYREADKYFESNMLQLRIDLSKEEKFREATIQNVIRIIEIIQS